MIYCYRTHDGKVVELVMTVAEMQRRQRKDGSITLDDGREAVRDYKTEFCGNPSNPGNWPMLSDGAGCHPSQIHDYQKHLKDAGCPTEYTPDGRAVFTSRAHRQKALRALGLHDRTGGFGD